LLGGVRWARFYRAHRCWLSPFIGNGELVSETISIFCSASSKEVEKLRAWLIPSLCNQKNVPEICLYLVNYTGMDSIYDGPTRIGNLRIEELSKGVPCGFGEAHNFAYSKAEPKDFFIIANPDVYCHQFCISELMSTRAANPDAALVEARQQPFEHPKEYDESTGYTPWASGFFLLIDSSFFRQVGGFDENFWMYCEDVDLSWRAWLNGFKVVYCPRAVGYHFTGAHFEYKAHRYYLENFWTARNFIYLAYKYWGERAERKAIAKFLRRSYPANFKQEVMKSYEQLKRDLPGRAPLIGGNIHRKLSDKVKITGFNLYHRERFS